MSQIYMGYGSNMMRRQMRERAPDSKFIGPAFLKGWKWIISWRGYANLVPSPGDVVYGLVYTVSPADEAILDEHEGVPEMYSKLYLDIVMGTEQAPGNKQNSLLYVDVSSRIQAPAPQEYIDKMNEAIGDARDAGIPESYIDGYLRRFIPVAAGGV